MFQHQPNGRTSEQYFPINDYITGISSTEAEQETDATYYTLDGVSMKYPTKKGIYIKNGKKVFINK